jgi:hypothetical protein
MTLHDAVDNLQTALDQSGTDDWATALVRLIDELPAEIQDEAQEATVMEALRALRTARAFGPLQTLCEKLAGRSTGELFLENQRFHAQSLIENGDEEAALRILSELERQADSPDRRSEAIGLISRIHKNRYIRSRTRDDLERAVALSADVFEHDPAWHGSNLMALTAQAERAGSPLPGPTAAEWAGKVLAWLRRTDPERRSAWAQATEAEAALVRNDADAAARAFWAYAQSVVSPFALAGTKRQLADLWMVDNEPQRELLETIVTVLGAQQQSLAGAQRRFTAQELIDEFRTVEATAGIAEALFGADAAIKITKLMELFEKAAFVCRIRDEHDKEAGGTGFLVDGGTLSSALTGQSVIITNHHVLYRGDEGDRLLDDPAYDGAVPLRNAVAEFNFWSLMRRKEGNVADTPETKSFRLGKILHVSPRTELDIAIATIEEPQGEPVRGLILSDRPKPFGSRNHVEDGHKAKIYVVGHPKGGELSFSFDNNLVIDHELSDNPEPTDPRYRRFHYRAPTDRGSSGSPVFAHSSLHVVGVHRTGRAGPLRRDRPGETAAPYEANEAISARSIREFVQ